MDFCPKCEKKMISLKKTKGKKVALLLSCSKCGYEKRVVRSIAPVSTLINHSFQDAVAVLARKEQKLRTLPMIRIECLKCGNNYAYAWMVQVRNLDESSTQFFRCTKCNHTFRENS